MEWEQQLLGGGMFVLKLAGLQLAGFYLGKTFPLGILVELNSL